MIFGFTLNCLAIAVTSGNHFPNWTSLPTNIPVNTGRWQARCNLGPNNYTFPSISFQVIITWCPRAPSNYEMYQFVVSTQSVIASITCGLSNIVPVLNLRITLSVWSKWAELSHKGVDHSGTQLPVEACTCLVTLSKSTHFQPQFIIFRTGSHKMVVWNVACKQSRNKVCNCPHI